MRGNYQYTAIHVDGAAGRGNWLKCFLSSTVCCGLRFPTYVILADPRALLTHAVCLTASLEDNNKYVAPGGS